MPLAPTRHQRARGPARPAVLLTAAAATLTLTATPPTPSDAAPAPPRAVSSQRPPNVVLLTTDDQTLEQLRHMPITRRRLGRHGVTFRQALSPHPLCCPARAEILTGQYGHNSGVVHNRGAVGGYKSLQSPETTVGAWLEAAGYQTSFIGKFLNGYRVADHGRPPGWTVWNPAVKNVYSYTRTRFWQDGRPAQVREHVDDAIGRFAARDIRTFASTGRPFFLWASHIAPHVAIDGGRPGDPVPAERHAAVLQDKRLPSLDKPSFNEEDVADQPPYIQGRPPVATALVERRHTRSLQSLQAVDEAVGRVVRTLRRVGELGRTYVVFASDNGYLFGEHRLQGKNTLHEEALRIPLVVRTPEGTRRRSDVPVTLVDLAPTFAELAGVEPQRVVDGRSFAGLLSGAEPQWRDTQLVQTGNDEGWEYRGARTRRYTYARRADGQVELLYDRHSDPFETENVVGNPAYADVADELRARLQLLRDCVASECSRSFGPVAGPFGSP